MGTSAKYLTYDRCMVQYNLQERSLNHEIININSYIGSKRHYVNQYTQ